MPIQILWRILPLLQDDLIILNLNVNVTAYRMRTGKLITKPNLPITFDERATTLLVHLMTDGYVADGQMPSYCNYDQQLLGEVKNCLEIFGNVPLRERAKRGGREIFIPTIIVKLLRKFFGKIQFNSHKARIPKNIWSAPPGIAAAAIRAFADDEATVLDRCIRFYSANYNFLHDIRSLLANKFSTYGRANGIPESSISPITESTGDSVFYFDITSKGLKKYQELIGFTHTKKQSNLTFWVKRISKSNWNHKARGVTRRKILTELSKGPKTARELSKTTRVSNQVINSYFLKKLEGKGLVKSVGKLKTREYLWALKDNIE